MRFYLDTEFDGFGGELISLALVSSDGEHEWYECMEKAEPYQDWVADNVIPVLGKPPISKSAFRASFLEFIGRFESVRLFCDWHTDIMHFCRLLDGENFSESVQFRGTFYVVQTPEGQPVSKVPHNALEDARALRYWFLRRCSDNNEEVWRS